MNLYSPTASALPYQWHRITAQQSGGRMQLFLDGKALGFAQTDTSPRSVEALPHIGALELGPTQKAHTLRRPFSGRIAELVVYDRLLTDKEIQQRAMR